MIFVSIKTEQKMKKKFKIGVIGAGFMASSIIKGVISSKTALCGEIIVSDISEQSLNNVKQFGVNVTLDSKDVCENSEYVIIAVKPQNFSSVANDIMGCSCNKFISIMAGVKKSRIKELLGDVKVARCMPNTPCSIGCGAVAIDLTDYLDEYDKTFIKSIFTTIANVVEIDEALINAVTGVSGSSPAYFYLFAKSIIDAGVKNGLEYETAKQLAVSTMIGAGQMILNNPEKSIEELITAVCSKGGTTIEAVKVYKENDISKISEKAVDACVKRAFELENL